MVMTRRRAHSPQTVRVLAALAEEPATWRHGYDLCADLELKSGSLYPILIRLCDRGIVDSRWESPEGGRPPRHLYRLTAAGLQEAVDVGRAPARAPHGRVRLGTA
jgi:PadR family transcriptional regulator, regulatory protein PadR